MAYTLIGSDNFTETTDTNLESHTPSGPNALASNWVHLIWQQTASAVVQQADDTVCQPYHSGTGEWNPYVIGPSAAASQKAEGVGVTGAVNRSIILKAANAATYWNGYVAYHNSSVNTFYIERIDNGVVTSLANAFDNAVSGTDTIAFEINTSGAMVLRKNGTSVLTHTDTTYTTGKPGVAVKKTFTSGGITSFSAYEESSAVFIARQPMLIRQSINRASTY